MNSWSADLCELLINTFTKTGDVIVDPLAGTCKILSIGASKNRNCYGYEIDRELHRKIIKTYNAYGYHKRGLLG